MAIRRKVLGCSLIVAFALMYGLLVLGLPRQIKPESNYKVDFGNNSSIELSQSEVQELNAMLESAILEKRLPLIPCFTYYVPVLRVSGQKLRFNFVGDIVVIAIRARTESNWSQYCMPLGNGRWAEIKSFIESSKPEDNRSKKD